MKDKKGLEKGIYTGISAFLLMVGIITLTIATSYAYFASKITVINPDNSKSVFTTANITAEYSDGNAITLSNAIPGTSSAIKTIKFTTFFCFNYAIFGKNCTDKQEKIFFIIHIVMRSSWLYFQFLEFKRIQFL